jgi:hypothetical protein
MRARKDICVLASLVGPNRLAGSADSLEPMNQLRIFIAFFVAPLVPIPLVGLYTILHAPSIAPRFQLWQLIDPGLTKVAYLVALAAGLPAYLLMRRMRLDKWWHYLGGGALLGCLPGLVLNLTAWGGGIAVLAILIGAPSGAVAGLAFWVLGVCSGPSR